MSSSSKVSHSWDLTQTSSKLSPKNSSLSASGALKLLSCDKAHGMSMSSLKDRDSILDTTALLIEVDIKVESTCAASRWPFA